MNQEQNNLNSNINMQNNNGTANNQPAIDSQQMMNQIFGVSLPNNIQHKQDNSVQPANNVNQPQSNLNQANLISNIQSENMSQVNHQANKDLINDDELLKEFIGNNYEKITTRPFNFAGWFFTAFYMFYRKMFLYGLLLSLVIIFILNFINNYIVIIIFNILVGFLVNKIYLLYAKKKINKIKQNNVQKDITEIKQICSRKGGTSVSQAFLGFFLDTIIAIAISLIMIAIGFTSAIVNLFSSFINGASGSNETYNGTMFFDTSVIMSNEFSISVPGVFKNNSSEYEYNYEYSSNQGIFTNCTIAFKIPTGYSSAENLINQMANYHSNGNPTDVEKLELNDINWYWFSYESGFGTTYYYGTTKGKKVYLLEYSIQESAPADCINYKQPVLNSIKKK